MHSFRLPLESSFLHLKIKQKKILGFIYIFCVILVESFLFAQLESENDQVVTLNTAAGMSESRYNKGTSSKQQWRGDGVILVVEWSWQNLAELKDQ
jgi:hypothetical protein